MKTEKNLFGHVLRFWEDDWADNITACPENISIQLTSQTQFIASFYLQYI